MHFVEKPLSHNQSNPILTSEGDGSDGGRELDVEAAQNSLLALGYTGLVQLVTVFVGAIEECMSVVHSVSEAMDTTFAPLLGTFRNVITICSPLLHNGL